MACVLFTLFVFLWRSRGGAPNLEGRMKSSFIFYVYRILRAVEQEAGLDGLDTRARALLMLIAEGDLEGTALSVGDVTRDGTMGTAPTVYTALNELESEGWIERRQDKTDGRTRRLCLTDSARKTFGRMSSQTARALVKK